LFLLAVVACKSSERKAEEAVAEGRAALQQGKFVEAAQAFDRAQALEPSMVEAVVGKAEVLASQQDGAHAQDILETCSSAPACQALSAQLVSGWLEAGTSSPLTASAAKHYVLALRRQEGEKCGLFAALAHANHLKPEQAADRTLLRETVRGELEPGIEVRDADPNAQLLQAAAASGKLAGSEEGCDAARQGETAMLGRITMLARMQGSAPDATALSALGAGLSRVYWSSALQERFRTSESAPTAAEGPTTAASAAGSDKAKAWPPQGPGCDAFQKCCEDIGKAMPTGMMCPLQLSKHGSCDEARRQMGLMFASTGSELPASCK
jgi:hypothetical protein